jgi:hypothetical protein
MDTKHKFCCAAACWLPLIMLLGLSAERGWACLSGTPPYNGSVCGKPPREGGIWAPAGTK